MAASHLRSFPGGSGPAPATRHSQVPGPAGTSRIQPSSGSSCKGSAGLSSSCPAELVAGDSAGSGRAGGAAVPAAAHHIMSLERLSSIPVSFM